MSGKLELTNRQILLTVLEKTFFHQRLTLEVEKYALFFRIVHWKGNFYNQGPQQPSESTDLINN